ncbi:MAG: hypothetical protein KGJ79_12930 [Alphaproteobacteria bacterium]|nr:hypothetical protein [Alphaproteobacteria bacterium]MDE2112041.1 hypothetical protein [Alphaproteobacteria bacterium]MDE2492425.1 hypothetical protein [Alphaproteobacteria bacterium]
MTEAKSTRFGGKFHDNGRSAVFGPYNSDFGNFCGRSGGRRLVGAKLGEEKRKMTPAARRPHFWRDIAILLAAKLVMLTSLYFLFFGPSHRPLADSAAVSARILGFNHR